MRFLRILLVLIVLAALGGGGYAAWRVYGAAEENGPLTLYGNVDIRQVDLAFNAEGRIAEGRIAEVMVEEGDRVEKGQVLARLESATYESLVDAASARLKRSQAQLRELERGTRPQEIRQARAAVAQAEAALAETRAQLKRRETLLERDDVSRAAYDQAERAFKEAKNSLEQRRAELDLAREGPREEEIQAARANVRFNRATLRITRERRDNTTLEAPAPGTVLTRVRHPGATVGPTEPVLTLALRTPMRVRSYVGETNLGRVEPGMPVTIRLPPEAGAAQAESRASDGGAQPGVAGAGAGGVRRLRGLVRKKWLPRSGAIPRPSPLPSSCPWCWKRAARPRTTSSPRWTRRPTSRRASCATGRRLSVRCLPAARTPS